MTSALKQRILNKRLLYIIDALKPFETRLVGGVVRDFLQGKEHADIDLATQATPQEMLEKLPQSKIKVFPTGIAHGTITAFYQGLTVEITTLRKDIKTDGRHADVKFTQDFSEDAQRRDFTINAIYMDETGEIFDPCGGVNDIKNEILRFIGAPDQRLREDRLRLLRYFRFLTKLKKPEVDESLKSTLRKHAPDLALISKERIWSEIQKILIAPHVYYAWTEMENLNVLNSLQIANPCLKHLKQASNLLTSPLKPLFVLFLLYPNQKKFPFKLSRKEGKYLKELRHATAEVSAKRTCGQFCYLLGHDIYIDALKANACMTTKLTQEEEYLKRAKQASQEPHHTFPLQGRDLIKLKVPTGKNLGILLKELEIWWVNNHFPGREEMLSKAQKRVKETMGAGE